MAILGVKSIDAGTDLSQSFFNKAVFLNSFMVKV